MPGGAVMLGYSAGAVLLHRKLLEWRWYQDQQVKAVFLHLLLQANWRDRSWRKLLIRRGQLLSSYQHLASELGLTRKQVRLALEKLRSTGEIVSTRAGNGLLVTLVNYEAYQYPAQPAGAVGGRAGAESGPVLKKENTEITGYDMGAPERELFQKLAAGGWEVPPPELADWLERYSAGWLGEAFSRALANCGYNPPPRYVAAVLENFAKKGGTEGAEKRRGSRGKVYPGAGSGSSGGRGKFSGHPAGGGGSGG